MQGPNQQGSPTASVPSVDVVVSAENNHYMAWQCLVFHHSCTTRTGHVPLFVVHGDEDELVEGFEILIAGGGRVQRVRNFRHAGPIMYAPRNQMRTVQLARTDADWLVCCDADMVFLEPFDPAALVATVGPGTFGLDAISFLVVGDDNRAVLAPVCERAGVDLDELEANPISGATPYVLERRLRSRLCHAWNLLLEDYLATAFRHHDGYDPQVWISSMWGLTLALKALGVPAHHTDLCVHTFGDGPVPAPGERPILHYSYPTPSFDKRRFGSDETWSDVWSATAPPGSLGGAVCDQIAETATAFGLV